MPGEAPSVNILNDWDLGSGKPSSKSTGSAPVGVRLGQLADHHSRYLRRPRLGILGVDSVVTDFRSSHHHDLTAIRWICKYLLVAGHVGGENHFGYSGQWYFASADYPPTKKGSVLKEEEPWLTDTSLGCQIISSVACSEVSWFACPPEPSSSVLARAEQPELTLAAATHS